MNKFLLKILLYLGIISMFSCSNQTKNLFESIRSNNIKGVEEALRKGAKVNGRDIIGLSITPLHLAANLGNVEIVKLLIKYGADVNALNEAGETPLDAAKINNYTEIIKILKESGAKE